MLDIFEAIVILLLDRIDLPTELPKQERRQTEEFLRQNSGKLAQPVTVSLPATRMDVD